MQTFVEVYDDLFDASLFINYIDNIDCFNKTDVGGYEFIFINKILSINNLDIKKEWLPISVSLNKEITKYRDTNSVGFNYSSGFCLIKNFNPSSTPLHFGKKEYGENIFGVIAFLNDDYPGGDIVFPFFNARIKPKAGSAIIFPASFPFSYSIESVETEEKKDKLYIMNWYSLSNANHNMIDHTSILPDGVL
jgi:hypothetical protein